MNKFAVSESTEIVLNGEKYLLEKGDVIILEKWKGDVKINSTGEHASKSISQLMSEVSNLKKKQESLEKQGKKADPESTKMIRELQFAIRAKRGKWKGKGVTK